MQLYTGTAASLAYPGIVGSISLMLLSLSVSSTAASTSLNGTGDKSSLDAANAGFYIYGSNTSTEFVVDGGGVEVPLIAGFFYSFFFSYFHFLFLFSSYSYSLQW